MPTNTNVFSVVFRMSSELETEVRNALLDAFSEALDAVGLQCGGGGGDVWSVWVDHQEADELITEEQRGKVIEWLKGNPLVLEFEVGPLIEAEPVGPDTIAWIKAMTERIEAIERAKREHRPADEIRALHEDLDRTFSLHPTNPPMGGPGSVTKRGLN